MALFKRKREEDPDLTLTPVEGLAGIAVLALYADDLMTAEEDADLQVYLWKMKAFRRQGRRELDATFRKMHQLAMREDEETLLSRCVDAIPEALHPTAYYLAADLVMGDDDFGEEERRYLDHLRDVLDIDEATATKVTDALAIKYAG